jgi:hypothetical protein
MKKAQIKIQQMTFMLIAVTLFLSLVLIFILVIEFSGIKEGATNFEEQNAMLLVSRLANSPEFSCEDAFGKNKINCIDSDKLIILRENIKNYEDFWGVSNIEVRKIFPKTDEKICTLSTYPNCNVIRLLSKDVSGFDASNFVILCRKNNQGGEPYDKCEIAKMLVSFS